MIRIIKGDCRDILRTLPDESVHCCVTSPPYFGLRDYGSCDCGSGHFDLGQGDGTGGNLNYRAAQQFDGKCPKCNGTGRIIGTDSQIGLEQTPQEYVEQLVAVFREVRRVLRDDGTLWLNLGDSYASGGRGGGANGSKQQTNVGPLLGPKRKPDGLKDKDLIGIPWRVAFALQADGWWLRQDIIWSKPNPMPESVTDRCTKAHEYLFLLSKSAKYYYDADAITEPHSRDWQNETMGGALKPGSTFQMDARTPTAHVRQEKPPQMNPNGRNKRSVWTIATQPYSEAHFATFPPALIEPCILAGTSDKGCCAKCGAPLVRKTARAKPPSDVFTGTAKPESVSAIGNHKVGMGQKLQNFYAENPVETIGWFPSCQYNVDAVPCTVIDPFAGAGTTGLVADRLGRNAILIELNSEYAAMTRNRIIQDAGMFAEMAAE